MSMTWWRGGKPAAGARRPLDSMALFELKIGERPRHAGAFKVTVLCLAARREGFLEKSTLASWAIEGVACCDADVADIIDIGRGRRHVIAGGASVIVGIKLAAYSCRKAAGSVEIGLGVRVHINTGALHHHLCPVMSCHVMPHVAPSPLAARQ